MYAIWTVGWRILTSKHRKSYSFCANIYIDFNKKERIEDMLKKHLKKAAALLVSIATILGTLPAMAASNEAESVEKSAVSTITDNEAKELSSDDALEMLKSESQTKEVEDNAAEKEKAESLKNYLTEMNIPVTAKEYTEQNGEVELQDDTETAKEYSGSYSIETTMWFDKRNRIYY